MSDVEAELREQFLDVFGAATYPVESPTDLIPALPDGPQTRFEAGDVSVTAMELAMKLSDVQDFPYEDAESLTADLLAGMREKGML
ncbi:MAG: MTH865 family protein [Halobacteriales archaeon]|nr:MTH865 family protein [Halobacteriales archaeon]